MRERDHEKRNIAHYVELEADDETVTHVERMLSTKVLGASHEVWDVRTDKGRYWVVTNPTNLYLQDEFKSADYALSFHLGISLRIAERSRTEIDEEREETAGIAWRKYEQAVDAYNAADEAEAYQAVGVHCREALIALAREVAARVATGEDAPPKVSDLKAWANLAAEQLATGRLRSYLKALAEKAWDIVVWLQHYEGATPLDAELVLDATQHVIATFGLVFVRHERGVPVRCPRCASYRVDEVGGLTDTDPDTQWHEKVCGACEHRWDHEFIRLVEGEGWVPVEVPKAPPLDLK